MSPWVVTQVNPPLELRTPKGRGYCHFRTDYGLETDTTWTVFLDSGEIWEFRTSEVRASPNITAGRPSPAGIEP